MKYNLFTLGELVTIKYGKNQKKVQSDDGTIPIYGTGGFMGYATEALYDKPSVLIGRKGTINKVRYVDHPFWTVDTLFYTEVNEDAIIPKYLYYLMSLLELDSYNEGTTIPSLRTETLNRLEFDVPDLEYQEKVLSVLEPIDKKIKLNEEVNENLQQQAFTLYGKYFPYAVTDDLPAGWRVGTVGEIVEIHDNKRIPLSGAQRAKMEKRIYPYYGAASLMDYVDEYIFDGKYLLLGEDGTVVDDAGYPILQYVWGQFWVNNHAHILTGKLGFNVESLLLLFKRTPVKSIVTGAVQPKISQANLRSIQVVVPPQPELDAFNEMIRPLFDQIRQNQDQNKALASLRDALLPKLMSGEIDVSDIRL